MSDFCGSATIRATIALAAALAGAAIAIATTMPGTPVMLSGENMPGIVVARRLPAHDGNVRQPIRPTA